MSNRGAKAESFVPGHLRMLEASNEAGGCCGELLADKLAGSCPRRETDGLLRYPGLEFAARAARRGATSGSDFARAARATVADGPDAITTGPLALVN